MTIACRLAVIASMCPALAAAQTPAAAPPALTMSEVVLVTGSLEPTGFDALSRAVHVIARRELERLGVESVVEGLRLVPGVDARARGPRDVQTDFAIRGATFGQSLVLVDGLRLNDSQSAHHNGDIPVPVAAVERIEVLMGAGSAVHGADALGGAINIISRRGPHSALGATAGQFGYGAAQASAAGLLLPDAWTIAAWGSRSSGFAFDRGHAVGGASLRGQFRPGWTADVRHQRKAFGAAGFYGNSPSKEWTDQTIGAVTGVFDAGPWTLTARALFRNHGDHFRWDINRPGFAENRHRTNAGEGTFTAARQVGDGRRLTFGGSGGADAVSSSNLGDHAYGRAAGFVEYLWEVSSRATLQAGLRADRYSSFGSAWSPTLSTGVWLSREVRLRASAARAFRIPTYTERYYRDPAHLASDGLRPERGWSADAGIDWLHGGWLVAASAFSRWDEDVIDWVKAEPPDVWRTTNVRDVTTRGLEAGVTRSWASGGLVKVGATLLDVDAPSLSLLSKYVLEYATRSIAAAVAVPLGGGFRAAVNLDYRRRYAGPRYTLLGARLARRFGRGEVFVAGTNLLNQDYYEIAGVEMPGRWVTAGFAIR
jgi:iron complex outermembrane receptor protein